MVNASVQSILLYGAEVWLAAARSTENPRALIELAVLVVASVIATDPLSKQRKFICAHIGDIRRLEAAVQACVDVMSLWRQGGGEDTRGRWTARFISNRTVDGTEPW